MWTPRRLPHGAIVLVVAVAALAGCAADEADGPGVEVLSACVEDAGSDGCRTLDTATFAALTDRDGVVTLDVRTPEEFAEGHLPGAVNLDVSGSDFPARIAELDPEATYAVYCRTGNRSQAAVEYMAQTGLTVAHLGDGIVGWTRDGGAVVTGGS